MDAPLNIRQLYAPLQPAAERYAPDIRYVEFLPEASLQPFIFCYWELKTRQPLTEMFLYRVVADGCMDLFFGRENPDDSYVMGFSNRYTEFPLGHSFHYTGVRFLPGVLPVLCGQDAAELANQTEPLRYIVPDLALAISREFSAMETTISCKTVFDGIFTHFLAQKQVTFDKRFYGAMDAILRQKGQIHVGRDLDTGLSERQLRRIFRKNIGDSAKSFSRIVRFQHFIREKNRGEKGFPGMYEAGYYDQAHFIREFRSLYGDTPGQVFDP